MMMFEHRRSKGIPIDKIADSVTRIYYPFKDEHLHKSLNRDIINALKNYADDDGEINEHNFVQVMQNIESYSNPDYHKKFIERIFKRYDKNKDGFLDEAEFESFVENIFVENFISFDAKKIFHKTLNTYKIPNQRIDLEGFMKIFNESVIPAEENKLKETKNDK